MLQFLIKGFKDVLISGDGFQEPDWRLAIADGSAYHDHSKLGQQWGWSRINLPRLPSQVMAAEEQYHNLRSCSRARAAFMMGMVNFLLRPRSVTLPGIEQMADRIDWIFQHSDEANPGRIRAKNCSIERSVFEAIAEILHPIMDGLLIIPRVIPSSGLTKSQFNLSQPRFTETRGN